MKEKSIHVKSMNIMLIVNIKVAIIYAYILYMKRKDDIFVCITFI